MEQNMEQFELHNWQERNVFEIKHKAKVQYLYIYLFLVI